ncbi:hypothetical protein [Helicobacter labacensis]|uniref:hypothetical protein n=1 Tax=Helicobacter labacensis TaxID=2316079 RepID=UPI0019696019|nr:hypothetical protein [Helicobacter labacensis]
MRPSRTPQSARLNILPSSTPSPLYSRLLGLLVVVSLILGVVKSLEISISYKEALLYFSTPSFWLDALLLGALRDFVGVVGKFLPHDLALRLPSLLLHALNLILLYRLSLKLQPKKPYDPLLSVFTFALLPGVQLGAILLGKVSLLFTLALSSMLLFHTRIFYALIPLLALFDPSCVVLLSAFFLYALKHKHRLKAGLLGVALGFNVLYFKPVSGMPQGFFLQTLFVMFVLYSPCLCLYYPYALYAQVIKARQQDSLVGMVGAVGFCLPLLLSLRQEINPQFLAYGVLGIPVLLKHALSSIRVHLPLFRTHYRIRYSLVFGTLLLESLYLWGGYNPFVRTHYIAKELASELQARGVYAVHTFAPKMALRLRFYGIQEGGNTFLIESNKPGDINITYSHKIAASYNLIFKP